MCNDTSDKTSILLAEYKAAVAGFNHFDSFRWEAGSLIIASSIVLLGFLIRSATEEKGIGVGGLGAGSMFITLLLAVWVLFAHHYRQLYISKVHRIREIEDELGMKLNTRLRGGRNAEYPIFGPKGHNLDYATFTLVALFGPGFSLYKYSLSMWLVPPVIIIILTLLYIYRNEKRMLDHYLTHRFK